MSNRKDVQQNSRRSPGSNSSTPIVSTLVDPVPTDRTAIDHGLVESTPDVNARTRADRTVEKTAAKENAGWQQSDVTVGGLPIRTYKPLALTTQTPDAVGQRVVGQKNVAQKSGAHGGPVQSSAAESSVVQSREEIGRLSSADSVEAGPELEASWSVAAKLVCCINTYPNGITVSLHDITTSKQERRIDTRVAEEHGDEGRSALVGAELENGRAISPQQFHLRFRDTRDYIQPTGRYFLYREQYLRGLEKHLSQLHHQGVLENTVVYFGTTTDPFLTLHKKFDVTMACLQILERYTPKLLVVQTRSPMVISALPTLKHLGARAVVGIPIETFLEKAVLRYTPGKPRIAERIIAADGLRKQGIRVNLMVSPILPYGDYERDAWDFAELLAAHGDYVTFGALATGGEAEERALKIMPVAQKLAADKQFIWLRPLCYRPVLQALKSIAPEKLQLPVKPLANKGQLNLFAA